MKIVKQALGFIKNGVAKIDRMISKVENCNCNCKASKKSKKHSKRK